MTSKLISPNRPSNDSVVEALQLAEQALQDALLAGADTASARNALEAARAGVAAERDAFDLAAREAADVADADARQAEAEAVAETNQQVAAAVATIKSAPGAEPLPMPAESPVIAAAVLRVQQVTQMLDQAMVPHHAATAERNALRTRSQAKKAELDAIRARRAAGDEQPGDGATMHALSLDVEDLGKLLATADAAVAATAPDALRQNLVEAESALAAARRRAELEGMVERVVALQAHFVAQVRALRLEAQRRGEMNLGSWFLPSEDLRKVSNGGWV